MTVALFRARWPWFIREIAACPPNIESAPCTTPWFDGEGAELPAQASTVERHVTLTVTRSLRRRSVIILDGLLTIRRRHRCCRSRRERWLFGFITEPSH